MSTVRLPDGRTVDETIARNIAIVKEIWPDVQDSDITIGDAFPEWS